jgi:hypothetical protein
MLSKLSTADVANRAGVHRDTLLRWLRHGLIPEPARDRHGWRVFSEQEASPVVEFARRTDNPSAERAASGDPHVARLRKLDWAFDDAKTSYLTHGIHPYPAKYIPQIPNALIQELSSVGETVGDVFCGSGTTLLEALLLKRNAIGVDANPVACLISSAKTTPLSDEEIRVLRELAAEAEVFANDLAIYEPDNLFGKSLFRSSAERPDQADLTFWFGGSIIEELAEIRARCMAVRSLPAKNLALVAFSSIIVAVSKQDSDTRYVRREKSLRPGDAFKRFHRALFDAIRAVTEFTHIHEPRFAAKIFHSDVIAGPSLPMLDLVVCSPPYPNAYSYHLYHRTRMLWLGMDQPTFKRVEIGSHRKYSSKGKGAATAETFRIEMTAVLKRIAAVLGRHRHACFVIGDSTIAGESIDNTGLLAVAGQSAGLVEVARITRPIKATAKAFNPEIGKIKTETILILENHQ